MALLVETQREVGEYFGRSQQWASQMFQKGVFRPAVDGKYDLDDCRVRLVDYLSEVASGDDKALAAERTRLAREQADKVALENAEKRKELISRTEAVAGWQSVIAHVRAKLLALPSRLAPQLVNEPKPALIKKKLTTVIHEALEELGGTRAVGVREGSGGPRGRASDHRGDGGVAAAAGPDSQRVG